MTKSSKKSIILTVLAFCLMIPAIFLLSACGNLTSSTPWKTDATSHWHVDDNGEIQDLADHTFVRRSDAENHWWECNVCKYKKDVVAHGFVDACDSICETCSYLRKAPHAYGDWVVTTNSHWYECALCHTKKSLGDHIFEEVDDDHICTGCNHIRSNFQIEITDTVYYGDPTFDHFMVKWFKRCEGGTDNDASLYVYEYFKLSDDGQTATPLTASELNTKNFPINAGRYRLKMTYNGGLDATTGKLYLPSSTTTTFEIHKRELTNFDLYVDLASCTFSGETNATTLVTMTAQNTAFPTNCPNPRPELNKIKAGDAISATITLNGRSADSIKNESFKLSTSSTADYQITLNSNNYCIANTATQITVYFTSTLANDTEATYVSATGNTGCYAFTFTLEAGATGTFTFAKSDDNARYEVRGLQSIESAFDAADWGTSGSTDITSEPQSFTNSSLSTITRTIYIKVIAATTTEGGTTTTSPINNTIKVTFAPQTTD